MILMNEKFNKIKIKEIKHWDFDEKKLKNFSIVYNMNLIVNINLFF